MMDRLPFPRITGKTSEEQIAELLQYLIQFKETLEFALSNISSENLSPELLSKISALESGAKKNEVTMTNNFRQIMKKFEEV